MVHANVGVGETLSMALSQRNTSLYLDPSAAVAYRFEEHGTGQEARREILSGDFGAHLPFRYSAHR